MKVRASDSRLLGKVSMAWRSCSLRGIGFAHGCLFSILDRTSEISSSDHASFPVGLLGQRLGQFCRTNDRRSSQA
jgi:hypothetical protein